MNFNFIYIFGLFVSITEFVSCFLLQPTLSTTEEWSSWAIVQQNPCLRLRTRHCPKTTADCNSTQEFSRCPPAHWEEWSPTQCTVENGIRCIITRTRNCSVPTLKNCQSHETGHTTQIWKDMNTCPCRDGTDNSNNYPSWSDWGQWECHNESYHVNCVLYRYRHCSNGQKKDCEKSGGKSYEINVCDDSCRSTDNSNNYPSWSEWGPWECHKEQVLCVIYRYRHCLHGEEVYCKKSGGTYHEMNMCDDSCEATTTPLSVPTGSSVSSLRSTTQVPSFISTVKMTSLTSTKFASVIAPFTKLSVGPTSPTSAVPVYWLDWTGWDCKSTFGVCLMSNTRNCSTYNTDDCENHLGGSQYEVHTCRKEICPAEWLDWGEWRCKMGYNGYCNMTRSRECSTGSTEACGSAFSMTRPCERQICPDKFDRQESGVCRGYNDISCTDASTCEFIKDPRQLICQFQDTATKSCPKACGCCKEEAYWLEWSDWVCHIMQDNICRMKRSRACSTNNTRDCVGMSRVIAACIDSICQSAHYSKNSKTTIPLSVPTARSVSSSRATTQAPSLISMVTMTSLTSAKSASIITPSTKPSVAQTFPSSAVPVYWLEWTGWDCQYTLATCLMSKSRNCSTFNLYDCDNQLGGTHYEVHTCRKEICPANWLPWGEWKCKMGYNGYCNMTRSRECSTGSIEACGTTFSMTRPCEKQVCPEKFERHESGQCRGYNATYCTDASTCGIITDPTHLICQFKNTAIDDCPKACGCCEASHVNSTTSSTTIEPKSMLTTVKTPTRLKTSDLLSTTSTASAQWSTWFEGQCSVSCGSGTAARLRHCSTGHDEDCIGRPFETIPCTATACSV